MTSTIVLQVIVWLIAIKAHDFTQYHTWPIGLYSLMPHWFNLFWYPFSTNVVSDITSTQPRFSLNPDCSTGTILFVVGCICYNTSLSNIFEVTLRKNIGL